MTPPESPPAPPLEPQQLQEVLLAVHLQVATALWLSAGMVLAVAAIACIAFGRRRAALACGLLYSLSLCFVHNGHAQVLGPAGCGTAVIGFFRPRHPGAAPRSPWKKCT